MRESGCSTSVGPREARGDSGPTDEGLWSQVVAAEYPTILGGPCCALSLFRGGITPYTRQGIRGGVASSGCGHNHRSRADLEVGHVAFWHGCGRARSDVHGDDVTARDQDAIFLWGLPHGLCLRFDIVCEQSWHCAAHDDSVQSVVLYASWSSSNSRCASCS
jgi:hypothetical protein